MPTVNEELQTKFIQKAFFLEGVKKGTVRRMIAFLQKNTVPELRKRLQIPKVPNRTTKRFQRLVLSTQNIFLAGLTGAKEILDKTLLALLPVEAQFVVDSLRSIVPVDLGFHLPNIPALRASLQRPFLGSTMGEHWRESMRGYKRLVQTELTQSAVLGETPVQMRNRLMRSLNLTKQSATRLARTGINHITTQAREITYEENSDIINEVQYVATLDDRTTDICISLDGKVFKVNEGPRPPMHHQCRSTTVPVIPSFRQFGLKDLPASTRASFNGQVPESDKGVIWLRKQEVKVQNSILGKGKGQAWRKAGQPDVSFVNRNYKSLTVPEFEKKLAALN